MRHRLSVTEGGTASYRLPIRILAPAIFNAPKETMAEIEPKREIEKGRCP